MTSDPKPRRRPPVWSLLLGAAVVASVVLVAIVVGLRPTPRRVVAVPASFTSDCSRPVDAQINAWLDSVPDGSTARFVANGCYRQSESLWLRDRKDLVVDGNGATFAFDTTSRLTTYYRSNWRILRGSGITLKNMTIRGACKPRQCANGTPPPEKDGYGQYGINLESTQSPTIDSVHVQDVLSDGIGAQGTLDPKCCWGGQPTSNLTIENSFIEHVGRQAISLTDVSGAVIRGSRIENGPEVGVDIEVDVARFVAHDIHILHNSFANIHANIISNGGLGSDPAVSNITIDGNTMASPATGCGGGIFLRAPGPAPKLYRSHVTITNNHFALIGPMLQAERIRDLTITGNTIAFKEVGCGEKAAVELLDSHSVKIAGNRIGAYAKTVFADAASDGVSNG